jgi:predicted nucleic acid-binding protein
MAITFALDTCVLSDLAQGDRQTWARLRTEMECGNGIALPRIAVYEFRRGILCGSVTKDAAERGELYLSTFTLIEMTPKAWSIGAELWARLFRSGIRRRIDHDVLISASAIAEGFTVATRNSSDYETIAKAEPTLALDFW